MRKTLLMLLAIMLSISGWSVNYTVSISTSDSEAGYVAVDISGDGDVNDETYHDTDENGNYTEFEVAKNRQITLTPVLNDDVLYYFAGWSDGKTDYPRTIKVTKDWDLTAVFEAYPTYTICAEANIAGAGTVDVDGGACVSDLLSGDQVWLNAEAEGGYVFLRWENENGEEYSSEANTQVTVTGDMTYYAIFEEIPTYTILVVADPTKGGDIDTWTYDYLIDEEEQYDSENQWENWITVRENTEIYIWARALDGYRFLGWYDGETQVYGPEYNGQNISFTLTENKTYTAKFEAIPTYTIHVVADPIKGGNIDTWTNDYANLIDEEEQYDSENQWENWMTIRENTEIYIWAAALDGYRFLGWYDGETQVYGPEYNGQNISFTLTENKTYTAKFEAIPTYTITVVANIPEGGEVYASASYGKQIDDQTVVVDYWKDQEYLRQVQIYAYIYNGYRFLGWYDGDELIAGPDDCYYSYSYAYYEYQFIASETKTYTARFEKIPVYTISVSVQPGDLFAQNENDVYVYNYATGEESVSAIQIMDGDSYYLYAASNGPGLAGHYRFHHWESDKGGYTEIIDIAFTATQDEHWTAVYKPDFGGYTQVGTTNLYYYDKGDGTIDIKGMDDNKYYGSTYGDVGYQAAVQINGHSPVQNTQGYEADGVKVTTSVLQSGGMARVVYKVQNTGSSDATVSLGAYADVKIGEEDRAPIETIRDDNNNVIGIVMRDGQGGQLYVIFGLGAAGKTLIDDYWFGYYGRNNSDYDIVGNYWYGEEDDIKEFSKSYYMLENGDYDSGMGWCWKDRTIAAGQTVMYSFMVGIGEVKMEPSATVELTPVDMNSWNDLSATHTMYAEGIYTHTTGIAGYLEYQVETSDADKWITLATDPQRLESDADFNGTFDVKFDASKSVHTIHFRTRDVMGNITPLPSKQFEDMRDYELEGTIVDKTYTGYAQTQDVLVSGIDAGKYTVSYTDNINAGTAKITLAGQYPHTIGYKQYTFTINPRPLVGDILFTTSYLVYDGNEHTPGWYLAGYNNLVENQDYTALWSNNILPGTATLKITGKGNYTGTLTTTFEILKMPFDETLYSVTLPDENILYDGNIHEATIELLADNMGTASVVYINRETGTETVPVAKGVYDVFVHVTDGALYYGTDGNLYAGTFTIYEIDDDEWTALQNIYNELITRGWLHPWDMSKGKAGVSGFAGVTITMGHVTGLDLSENGLTGTFPTSVLYLPYLETLGLYGNHLSGAIESGMDAYAAWAAEQGEDDTETIDVYVQKPTSWSSAGIWAWTGYNNTLVNLFDEWPGVEMTETTNGWWKYSGLPKGVSVVINDGSYSGEQSRDIPDNGHGGGLQSDTWIVLTNEMVTTSGIGHGYEANWWSEPVKGIRHINIANNEFTGNIGAFASYFPHLNTLQAQHNHIEEVMPMISPDVTSLNLNNQTITTQRTIDLTQPQTMSGLLQLLPRVILYKHAQQTYQLSGAIKIVNSLTEPTWNANITIGSDNQVAFTSATGNEFPFGTEDVLYAVESTTGMSFPVNVLFNAGDANFDCAVDVLDLQAIILFIKDEYTAQIPFNFTAANLFNDGVINVQDIVLMIERLLAEEEPQTAAMRRLPEEEDDEAAAELRWENGELHLISETAVAAMDLNIRADAAIEWLIPTHTVAARQTADGQHAVIYSLAGNTLAENKDIVIARSGDPAPVTVHAALADKEAKPVTVRLRTVSAKLPTDVENVQGDDMQSTKVIRNGVLYIERGGKMYDATGRLIEK